jgi:uncharacterized protein
MTSMGIPQRMTFVTIGTRSVPVLRAFYRSWGWAENDGGSDDYASFDLGGTHLSLYPVDRLRNEAAPGADLPAEGQWNGVTFAINLASKAEVEAAHTAATRTGAESVAAPVDREWGGYSAYVADPEGNRWELAWAPDFDLS